MERRCFATLIARGNGSYVTPQPETRPLHPDYVRTALPLLCSFQHLGSAYPLHVLAAGYAEATLQALRTHGVNVRDITNLSPQIDLGTSSASEQCLLRSKGSWQVHGRSDFASTMHKLLLWQVLRNDCDAVAFVDADSIFTGAPVDGIFDTVHPQKLSQRQRGRMFALRDLSRCGWPEDKNDTEYRLKPLCPALDFAARLSSRKGITEVFLWPKVANSSATHPFNELDPSEAACRRPGWSSGFFVTRPAPDSFDALHGRAIAGNFSLFTRTEQDVIDDHFDPRDHCVRTPYATRDAARGTNRTARDSKPQLDIGMRVACSRHAALSASLVSELVLHHKLHAYEPNALPTRSNLHIGTTTLHNLSRSLCASSAALLEGVPPIVPVASSPHCRKGCPFEMTVVQVARQLLTRMASPQASG